jgi:predicted dehydrogenase
MTGPHDGLAMRLCFLGCGKIAGGHSRTLRGLKPHIQCSYASRTLATAQAMNAAQGGAGAFGSYAEAVASPSVDVVAVVTPPSSHSSGRRRWRRAGRDLEKPPVLRSADFDDQRACPREAACVNRRKLLLQAVAGTGARHLASGAVGEPLFIT